VTIPELLISIFQVVVVAFSLLVALPILYGVIGAVVDIIIRSVSDE